MGSTGSPNTWTPYDSYKDCAQGFCNIYCPQWCSYPPPDPGDYDSGTTFSPLIIAVIGILASAFLLVSYYAIITKYCRRRQSRIPNVEVQVNRDEMSQDQWQVASAGLDESLISSITVFKYNKGDKLVEGTECSVCLNEFQENENLRLLPKCCHAFHPSCIDIWLKSHTNCPLCRANAAPTYALPVPTPAAQTATTVNISALEIQPQHDLVFVVEGTERSPNEESFASNVPGAFPKSPLRSNSVVGNSETRNNSSLCALEEERQIRRSISLGTFSSQRSLLVADILRIEEDEEDLRNEICQPDTSIGSSKRIQTELEESKLNNTRRNSELFRTPATVSRSFSTGRFYFHKISCNLMFPVVELRISVLHSTNSGGKQAQYNTHSFPSSRFLISCRNRTVGKVTS